MVLIFVVRAMTSKWRPPYAYLLPALQITLFTPKIKHSFFKLLDFFSKNNLRTTTNIKHLDQFSNYKSERNDFERNSRSKQTGINRLSQVTNYFLSK